ncbi:MAG: restriction endonuclease [Chloroflexi bacterium]|nr:restriction endonuclease [Chloroflexota bacterium]
MELATNVLYYGDNLDILRKYIPDNSVDLTYLDPPFNSRRSYNILFKESEHWSEAQVRAFGDTWHWTEAAEKTYLELVQNGPMKVAQLIDALHRAIGENDVTAYLVMMAIRLVELHRVLKDTGSLWLHCDPTASHYLKLVLDQVFGPANFQNEIVWKRSSAHSDVGQGAKHMGRIHDVILFYSKGEEFTSNTLYTAYDKGYLDSFYRHDEPGTGRRYTLDNLVAPGAEAKGNPQYEFLGVTRYWRFSKERMQQLYEQGRVVQTRPGTVPRYKRYLDDMPGLPMQDVWDDIPPIGSQAKERLGYPTQKPQALLERIVSIASNEGDVVLDPFCGCGTAVVAAQRLDRRWIGIDVTHLAIAVMKKRLEDSFPGIKYEVVGEPKDVNGARALAHHDRYQFQWWALSLVKAQPVGEKKKGADKGIDGVIRFMDDHGKTARRAIVQVKSGAVHVKDIRELRTVSANDAMGVFITLLPPTEEMKVEAVAAGSYHSPLWDRDFPRIQIVTIEELFQGKALNMPPITSPFAKAPKVAIKNGGQEYLFDANALTAAVSDGE